MQRYYPVKDLAGVNRTNYLQYLNYNRENEPKMQFIGRCGMYAYCDMDQAIAMSLSIAKKYKSNAN
jgi:UDP-galactopyranose mutase